MKFLGLQSSAARAYILKGISIYGAQPDTYIQPDTMCRLPARDNMKQSGILVHYMRDER